MNKKIGASIIAIVIILVILGMIGIAIYSFIPIQSLVPVISSTYTCPSGKTCQVTPILDCTTKSYEPRVIFRTNGDTNLIPSSSLEMRNKYQYKWVAVDLNPLDDDDTLTKFIYDRYGSSDYHCTSRYSVNLKKSDGFQMQLIDGTKLYFMTSTSKLYISLNCGRHAKFKLDPTNQNIETGTNPILRYTLANQEIQDSEEQGLYSCSRKILIDNQKVDTMTWSKNFPTSDLSPKGYRKSSFSLSGGQTIKFSQDSGELGGMRFEYTASDVPITTCTSSSGKTMQIGDTECKNQYILEKCESVAGKPTITTQEATPPQVCRNGVIDDAYNIEIKLAKTLISTSENFNVDFKLSGTEDNLNIPVTVAIFKGSSCSSDSKCIFKTQLTGNTYLSAGKTQFILESPPVGYYTLRVSFNHDDGDFSKDYNVQVTEDLSVVLSSDDVVQFDSSPIVVYLKSFRSGSPKPLVQFELEAEYNGKQVYQYLIENPDTGILKISFVGSDGQSSLKGDGDLRLRARGSDESGLWTEWTDYYQVSVRKSSIVFKTDFISDKCTGSYNLKFETRDSKGNPIETQNNIEIDKPQGGKDTVSASGKDGSYSFSYNFIDGGTYVVRITATNSQIGSSQLNSGQGQIVNILTGESCKNCEGLACVNWTLYIIIGVLIMGVILFVYLVFFRKR